VCLDDNQRAQRAYVTDFGMLEQCGNLNLNKRAIRKMSV
jgi:hypothetical protein